jgi:hypothetical protein
MAEGLLDNIGATTPTDPTNISQGAQDTSKALGVSYEDLAKTEEQRPTTDFQDYDVTNVNDQIATNVDFKPTTSYIDEAKDTVAGQLNTLLADDNPYIQQAKQSALEQSASRGLQNTTLAAEAGRTAAIKAALPIAQQDAQTFAEFEKARQGAEYNVENIKAEAIVSSEMVEQKAAITEKTQQINNAFQARMAGADEQSKAWLADLQNSYNVGLQNLDAATKTTLTEMELNAKQAQGVADASAAIMQNYQVSVENMMTDPDFLNLGADAVNNAINQLQTLASNSIKFIGKSQGVDMDPFVDAYLSDLDVL